MQTQPQLLRLSAANLLFPSLSPLPNSQSPNFPIRPTRRYSLCSAHKVWLAQLSEELTTGVFAAAPPPEEGPIELRQAIPSFIAAFDDPSLRTATSVLFTGAFSLFLFRSLRRRIRRAKQMKLRSSSSSSSSSGAEKSMKEEAMANLKALSKSPIKRRSPPSPDDAFLGALIAAAFGVLLYKFTTTVEYNLNHQTLSNNYSVRQITITIRTIINGLCYLATFVFGFNSLGLFLYSGQLALNSFVEAPSNDGGATLKPPNSRLRDVDSSKIVGDDKFHTKNKEEE